MVVAHYWLARPDKATSTLEQNIIFKCGIILLRTVIELNAYLNYVSIFTGFLLLFEMNLKNHTVTLFTHLKII